MRPEIDQERNVAIRRNFLGDWPNEYHHSTTREKPAGETGDYRKNGHDREQPRHGANERADGAFRSRTGTRNNRQRHAEKHAHPAMIPQPMASSVGFRVGKTGSWPMVKYSRQMRTVT